MPEPLPAKTPDEIARTLNVAINEILKDPEVAFRSMYYRRYFVGKGGLISYGPDIRQQFSGVAEYVDRVLKGAKPADLPVQAPTKCELVINLKTAKSLGLELPQGLLSAADEVIE